MTADTHGADWPGDPDRPAPRSRRRGAALERAILGAAWDELAAVGYAEVTMAAVAARAGTSKAVLYRRWPNRVELLATAIDRRVTRLAPTPVDTGSLRGNVIAVLSAMNRRSQGIIAVPDPGGELAAFVRRRAFFDSLDQLTNVLHEAGERGEIDTDTLTPRIIRLPLSILHSDLCLENAPVSSAHINEIVDNIFLPLTAPGTTFTTAPFRHETNAEDIALDDEATARTTERDR